MRERAALDLVCPQGSGRGGSRNVGGGPLLLRVLGDMTVGAVDGGLLMASLLTESSVTLLALLLAKAVPVVLLVLLYTLYSELVLGGMLSELILALLSKLITGAVDG